MKLIPIETKIKVQVGTVYVSLTFTEIVIFRARVVLLHNRLGEDRPEKHCFLVKSPSESILSQWTGTSHGEILFTRL